MWTIIKYIKNKERRELPIILLDSQEEILEFETEDEAQKQKNLFLINSDSDCRYEIKKI